MATALSRALTAAAGPGLSEHLRTVADGVAGLVYIDPPFNTGRRQERRRLRTVRDEDGDRTGFGGRRYRTVELGRSGYDDAFDDYQAFLRPRLEEARRILAPDGSFFLHVDPREVHAIYRVPIEELLDPQHRISVRHPSGWRGPAFLIGDDKDLILWGFTAGVIARLFDFLGWARPWDENVMRDLPDHMLALPETEE